MKAVLSLALSFVCIGLVASLWNLVSGWTLVYDSNASSEMHLVRALGIVGTTIIGSLILLKYSQTFIEHLKKESLTTKFTSEVKSRLEGLSRIRQDCFIPTLTCIIVTLFSLVTGTTAHAGRFPWLHGIVGMLVIIVMITSLAYWLRCISHLLAYERKLRDTSLARK